MTLFLILFSTINIALGYGLALYFGHGKMPWQIGISELSINKVAARQPTTAETDTLEVSPPMTSETQEAAAASMFDAQKEPSAQQSSNETVEPEKPETVVEAEPSPAPPVEAAATPAKTAPQPTQPQETTPATPKTPAPELAESTEATTSNAEESSNEPIDEKFIEGIAAFQNQLNDSQSEQAIEDSSAAAEEETKEEETVAEENTDQASPGDDAEEDAEDVLAGINSFRAQLEEAQGNTETSTEDSESAATEETEEAETVS